MKFKLDENFGTRTQHVFPQETGGIVVNGTTGNCVGSVSSSRRQVVRSLRKASWRFIRDVLSPAVTSASIARSVASSVPQAHARSGAGRGNRVGSSLSAGMVAAANFLCSASMRSTSATILSWRA
jgi:hypothetical protein